MDQFQRLRLYGSAPSAVAAPSAIAAPAAEVTHENDQPPSSNAVGLPALPVQNAVVTELKSALAPDSEFTSYVPLMTAVHSLRTATGMPKSSLSQKSSKPFDSDEAEQRFGIKEYDGKCIIRRGRIYCSHKEGEVLCTFNLPISFKYGKFVVKKDGNGTHCLEHNHTLEAVRTFTAGKELIDKMDDLEPDELAEVQEASLSLVNSCH